MAVLVDVNAGLNVLSTKMAVLVDDSVRLKVLSMKSTVLMDTWISEIESED